MRWILEAPSRWCHIRPDLCEVENRWMYTVQAVSNCVGHDGTSYAVLKRVEVEFWCGTCRFETGTQCSVRRVNVEAAHFGARVLKKKPPGGGAMPNRRENRLLQGVNADEIGWNFCRRILTPWPTISTGIHSPGPPALWASMQKPRVQVERLLRSVRQQKGSDRGTLGQVNKTHWWQSGNLDLDCHIRYCWEWSRLHSLATAGDGHQDYLLSLLLSLIRTTFSHCCWGRSGPQSSGVRTPFSRYCWGQTHFTWMMSLFRSLMCDQREFLSPVMQDNSSEASPMKSLKSSKNFSKLEQTALYISGPVACTMGTRSRKLVTMFHVFGSKNLITMQRCFALPRSVASSIRMENFSSVFMAGVAPAIKTELKIE